MFVGIGHPIWEYSEAVLRGLNALRCPHVPTLLEIDRHGRQLLTYINGTTAYPPYDPVVLSEESLRSCAAMIRQIHDKTVELAGLPESLPDSHETARPLDIDCIGHGDIAPWNIVFDGSQAVALIDWDTAAPSSRVWDMAYLAHHMVPFHSDSSLAGWGWHEPPNRKRRLDIIVQTYGPPLTAPDIVEAAIIRLCSMGSKIQQSGRGGDPRFHSQFVSGQGPAYFAAAESFIRMSEDLF